MSNLYTLEKPEFYDDQANSWNPLRRWFHRRRNELIRELVDKYGTDPVLDIGCGNVLWNHDKAHQVVGVDINPESLLYNIQEGRIIQGIPDSVDSISLPDNFMDTVVCSEVLEHIPGFWKVIGEAYRILKPGGVFITSVPYDRALSLWRPLFEVWCVWQGYIMGDGYYKQRCGHVNHFRPETIKQYLAAGNFTPVEQFSMKRFTIFTVVRKPC